MTIFKSICATVCTYFIITTLLFLASCSGDSPSGSGEEKQEPEAEMITLKPSETHQEMVGFGGALTWYCDRITSSSHKDEITHLIFEDLGTDIVRLKNWYFPDGYPENKSPEQMEVSWFKPHFDATNELYNLTKSHNSEIDVLLSSWTPPSSLKSNGELEEGTLKKNDNGEFMYEEFTQYWMDVLENISFTPDYLSIQNEPTYSTDQWETCVWRASETDQYPGYDRAIEMVHQQLQGMENAPQLIGPESQDLRSSSFDDFADVLAGKDYVTMYAYHPYNFNSSTSIDETDSYLNNIKQFYSDKPNIMTEYSGLSWIKTAQFISNVLVEANASGYIYWEMMWDENSENAMIQVDGSGEYEVTPFYYVIKHFAKHVDKGYHRIGVESESAALFVSGFSNPGQDQLTLVVVNPYSSQKTVQVQVEEQSISSLEVYGSQAGDFYSQRSGISPGDVLNVPANSITTVVLNM